MRIITKKDFGKEVKIGLHEFFGVEVASSNPQNEYLAVPSFIQKQNFEIIKEYNYPASKGSNVQQIGKRIYLLLATKISQIDLSWYNLATAEEELYFMLNVQSSPVAIPQGLAYSISDNDMSAMPQAISHSDVL